MPKKNNITTERRFEVTAKEGMGSGDPVIATFSFLGDASFYFVSEWNDGRFDAVIRHRKQRKKKKKMFWNWTKAQLAWRKDGATHSLLQRCTDDLDAGSFTSSMP